MPKTQMIINTDHPEECRAAILEDGKLEEYIVEHSSQELLKGNVYLGVVTRVEPAIEAAFVDYGGRKFGFLPFKDVQKESYRYTGEKKSRVRIQDVMFSGQKLLLQVVKEERDHKGPTLSNFVTIPGRYLVLMSGSESTGVSRKIEDEEERKNLKSILSNLEIPENMGVIVRTAGVGRTKPEVQEDFQMLWKIWETIKTAETNSKQAPALLYRGPDMVVRTVRDHFTNDTEEILVDTVESFDKIKEFFHLVMPKMESHVKLYQGVKPIFSHFGVEAQIESIYERKVPLPGGGSLVIDASEALVAIDVNSGKTTSSSDLEETATRTNLEAADEVGRQLRLRDLGGLIVIDFIDMFSKKNKAKVEKQLRLACKKDKARVNLSRISRFGLMEMSRQRMSPSVKVGAFDRCGVCRGTGNVRSRNTAAVGVLRRIQENLAPGNVETLDVTVSPEIAAYLLNNKTRFLMELEDKHHVKIVFQAQPGLAFDEFTYNVASRKRSAERSAESRAEPSEGRSDEKRKRSGERSAESRAEPESRLSGEQPAETRAESDPQLTEEQIEEKLKRELRQEKTLFFAPESESRDSLFSEVIHGSVLGASIPEGMLQRSGASTLGTSEQKKYDDKRGDKRGRSGREPRGRQPQGDKPRGGSRGGRDSKRGSSSGRPHQEGEQGKKWPDRPPRTANPPAVETNKTTDWINEDIGGGKPVLREPPSSPAPDSGAPESKLFKNESGGDNFKGLNEDVKPSFTRPDEPPAVIG